MLFIFLKPLVALIISAVTAVLSYAITFANFQREYPDSAEDCRNRDRGFAIFMGFMTFIYPFGVIATYLQSGFARHGLKFI